MQNVIEWQKVSKTFPGLLTGPTDNMVSERMNADLTEIDQSYNFAYYARLQTNVAAEIITFQIPENYYYWLFGFRAFWPLSGEGDEISSVYFRIVQTSRSRRLEIEPIPINIYATPGQFQPMRYRVDINNPFLPNSRFQFFVTYDPTNAPEYIDIMTDGVRIPSNLVTEF